jgi:hypothetical protein
MRKPATCPKHKENKNRSNAKLARGRGRLAIERSNISDLEWSQKHDPLFKVKGKERHRRLHS